MELLVVTNGVVKTLRPKAHAFGFASATSTQDEHWDETDDTEREDYEDFYGRQG
jgi:hypothetical protein